MTASSRTPRLAGLPTTNGADAASALSIESLRYAAARDPKAAIRETAKQFEALFMQQLMKSMREATMSSGMLDNSGTQLGTEMLDTQFATKMTGLPGGLAARSRASSSARSAAAPRYRRRPPATAPAAPALSSAQPLSQRQVDFVRAHQDAARQASPVRRCRGRGRTGPGPASPIHPASAPGGMA